MAPERAPTVDDLMQERRQQRLESGRRRRNTQEVHFRSDAELHALLNDAAIKANSSPSIVARELLRAALKQDVQLDVRLETMRLASHTIRRAASLVLKEVTQRLPEILKDATAEIRE